MSIGIVTDSTCDLPEDIVREYDIRVVPLYINIGERGYLDGVEITRQEFYARLPEFDPHPTTGTPGTIAFRDVYRSLAEDGATQVLSIHISKSLSATVDVARIAAREMSDILVTVLDSRQLSLGTGFLVERAAQAASNGYGMDAILSILEDQILRTNVFAALDTLEFLHRSGRMNSIVAGLGSLLRLKPILTMYDGEPDSKRVRTSERANRRLVEMLEALQPFERVAFVHTHAPERIADLMPLVDHMLPPGETLSVDITPVIGAHIGPGAAGFAVVTSNSL
jgi:DegV family protein with EDD domain